MQQTTTYNTIKMKRLLTLFIAISITASLAAQPRAEYPRPQFERSEWINLNGEWSYSLDNVNTGFERRLFDSKGFDDKIIVPFCPESKLSGVGHKDFITGIWYHRTLQVPASWAERRIMLNFGAVYYESEVYIDGKFVGRHIGGSDSFAYDISDYVADGKPHDLVVRANSDLRSRAQGAGKQSLRYNSFGCLYSRTTGIWQTVWVEATSDYSLEHVQVITDIDQRQVVIIPRYYNTLSTNTLTATISENGKTLAKKSVATVEGMPVVIPFRNFKTWSPEEPNLYDVEYVIRDKEGNIVDRIKSYLGMRKIHVDGNRIYLNNQPYYQRLVLDQGFYPDGNWTAPSDEALRRDIELSKAVGFNGARLHQKVFEERYHYWADKLGYLCWGEYASWGIDEKSPIAARNFLPEWGNIIIRDRNHPSIVVWTPFNEVWWPDNVQYPRLIEDTYILTHALDPTRPVNTASGGTLTPHHDICCMHHYEQDPAKLGKKVYNDGKMFIRTPDSKTPELASGNVPTGDQVDKYPLPMTKYDGRKPYLIDEFGGIKCLEANPIPDVTGREKQSSWGYGDSAVTREDFYKRLEGQVDALLQLSDCVWGFCYTQLTDVEQEENGLYYYDRRSKYDAERLKGIFAKPLTTNEEKE